MKIEVECNHCHGTGKMELQVGYKETLNIVRSKKRATATDVRNATPNGEKFHPTAFNNRLVDLMDLGFIGRERVGRHWVYFPVKPTTPTKP